jgi:hypothetical protein
MRVAASTPANVVWAAAAAAAAAQVAVAEEEPAEAVAPPAGAEQIRMAAALLTRASN